MTVRPEAIAQLCAFGRIFFALPMKKVIAALIAVLVLTSGCVHYHYSPNFVQTPWIGQKGDATATAAISGGPRSLNGDFQVAYSPIKHGAVFANYYRAHSSYQETSFFGSSNYRHVTKSSLIEAGIGAYRPLFFGTGAVYAGIGGGRVHNDYGINRLADLRMNRMFVQPTFTFKNKWFRLGMGAKIVRVNYTRGNIDYRIEPADIEVIERLEQEAPLWFPEIGGNIGFHFKPITIQAGIVLVLSNQAYEYGIDGSNAGIGITYEFQVKSGKKAVKQ